MTRDEAKRKAWFKSHPLPECVAQIDLAWDRGFDAGWAAREAAKSDDYEIGFNDAMEFYRVPNLQPVIDWLEKGCDPKEAAKELRIYQAQRSAK